MNPRLRPATFDGRALRLIAQVSLCALVLGMVIGVGATSSMIAPDDNHPRAIEPRGTHWSADHAKITETARPIETF